MLELPGLTQTGDLRQDLDTVRRYLTRLVPQLEMELADAQTDSYSQAYSALSEGLPTNTGTTAGALAAHELRRDNPHRVTAAQLGLSLGSVVSIQMENNVTILKIGEKRGVQIMILDRTYTVEEAEEPEPAPDPDESMDDSIEIVNDEDEPVITDENWHTTEGADWADIPLGEWPAAMIPIWAGVSLHGGTYNDYWAGAINGTTRDDIGRVRIYRNQQSNRQDGTRVIPVTIIGVGVFGYGEAE